MRPLFSAAALGALVIVTSATSSAAVANGLRTHQEINDGLKVIAIADMIRKKCDSISPRMLRAYRFAKSLEAMAKAEGYSDDQIEAFVENKREKARVEGAAKAYLVSKGVTLSSPKSYCVAGRAEIERSSQVGQLLRSR